MPEPLPADPAAEEFAHRLAARLLAGPHTVHLRERREGDGLAAVAAALRLAGLDALHCPDPGDHVPELLREARLGGRAVVVPGLPEQPGPLVRALTAASDVTVLITDPRPYDPHWSPHDPLVLEAPGRRAGGRPPGGPRWARTPTASTWPPPSPRTASAATASGGPPRPPAPSPPSTAARSPPPTSGSPPAASPRPVWRATPPHPARRRLDRSGPARQAPHPAAGTGAARPAPRPGPR